ncbi:MAG: AraC family transcriptional regulator [Defluviitaleaceae bacterium]|nr:AraC family transcriptional regulator [Defluviitaleaceae bacterium]
MAEINGKTTALTSPCILLTSRYDRVSLSKKNRFNAKSLCFHPSFINKSLNLEVIKNACYKGTTDEHDHILLAPLIADKHDHILLAPLITDEHDHMLLAPLIADEHDCMLLAPFLARDKSHNGIINPSSQIFLRISDWFDLACGEGLFRARRYIMQILLTLEEARSVKIDYNALSDEAVVNAVLEHIHANFSSEITLDSLCKLVCSNRTTLTRKFRATTRRTPIDYLLHHRLNVACKLLTHSKLSVKEIAETTGFKYESYFTRQFSAKNGLSPKKYRQSDGYESLNINELRIIEEF